MGDTATQDAVEETEQAAQTAQTAQADEEPILEPLIEEVSIDGMCGVY